MGTLSRYQFIIAQLKKASLALILIFICNSASYCQYNFTGSGVSLKFPGSINDYIDLGDSYNTLTFPFTFEAWINPDILPAVWGGIIGSDNDVSNYYGFWIRTSSSNTLEIEFGDGFGSGYQFRRGYITNSAISLNKWTHVAIVCTSVTDVKFYFNGVQQTKSQTDGGSSTLLLTHSSAAASLGGQSNVFGNEMFIGQLDEIRLWNIERSQTDVRDNMCRKIDPATSGLIGYWTNDDSYTSSIVADLTVPAENGTLGGAITRITSGAPIGDASVNLYTSNWNGVFFSLGSPYFDSTVVYNVSGNPKGLHIYRVDSIPYDTLGLDTITKFYFGVFCAPGNVTPLYDLTYHYALLDGAVTASNESTAQIYKRPDGAITFWTNSGAFLDLTGDSLFKSAENERGEYIIDVKNVSGVSISATDTQVCEKFCVDFFDQSSNNPAVWEWTFEGGNPAFSAAQNPTQICYAVPGIYDVTLITSGAFGSDTVTLNNYITVNPTPSQPSIAQSGYLLTSSPASSYQWQFNSLDIPGATNQSYFFNQSGYYTVVISDDYGCVNSASKEVLITGIDEVMSDKINIYPNPVFNALTIELSQISPEVSTITITDMFGKVWLNENTRIGGGAFRINTSQLVDGLYVIHFASHQHKMQFTFSIQN